MPAFAYTALDTTGKTVSGAVSVRNKAEVYRELAKKSLSPVSVREESDAKSKKSVAAAEAKAAGPPPKLKRTTLILFTYELADLLDAGMQLEQALRILYERQEDPFIKRVAGLLRDDIREGTRFSVALKKASPSFDELYTNLIAAGEASGSLALILRRLADNLKVIQELQQRVVSALIYPAFLFGLAGVLVIVIGTVVLPQLTSLLENNKGDMPLMTSMLLASSDFLSSWWWLVVIAMVAMWLLFKLAITSPKGRAWWDRYKLGAPLFGPVIANQFCAQFSQSLGNLVNNGVPLLSGLRLMTRATPNIFLNGLLKKILEIVAEGGSLSGAMRKVGWFPGLLMDLVAIGEQTGHLGQSLQKAAVRYDGELGKRIDRLTKIIPPIVLILIGIVVMVVAFAIISTLFQSITSIRSQA
ncbi:MAG: type II secretory pathway component PulF [Verrucomicrobiales bacterium]|jgi:type II secretory pathway component PulF